MSDYKVATLTGRPRRTIRRWSNEADKIDSFKGNVKRKKFGRKEEFPDPAALAAYMTKMREYERARKCTHHSNWTKKHHREWLNNYLLNKTPATPLYTTTATQKMKFKKEVLTSLHEEFFADLHQEFQAIDDDGRYNAD
ncbi:unnamed protein product [Aphanomyces euteiches]